MTACNIWKWTQLHDIWFALEISCIYAFWISRGSPSCLSIFFINHLTRSIAKAGRKLLWNVPKVMDTNTVYFRLWQEMSHNTSGSVTVPHTFRCKFWSCRVQCIIVWNKVHCRILSQSRGGCSNTLWKIKAQTISIWAWPELKDQNTNLGLESVGIL